LAPLEVYRLDALEPNKLRNFLWFADSNVTATLHLVNPFISTLCVRDLDVNKINIGSRFFLGSFFIENLDLKKHIINIKTAVLMTDFSKCDGFR
jgi:hypothetical protein